MTHDLSPISASGYFAQALEVEPPGRDTVFRAYYTPSVPSRASEGAGGSSSGGNGTLMICHHGAGASGLSFAALAKAVRDIDPELGVLAYDARGHGTSLALGSLLSGQALILVGKSVTRPPGNEHDLSLRNLLDDLVGVITHLHPVPKTAPALLVSGAGRGEGPMGQSAFAIWQA